MELCQPGQKLKIREIKEKSVWEDSLLSISQKTFTQSWHWGEFQKILGEKVWRLGVFEEKKLWALAQVIMVKAKRGTFLLLPHGPIIIQNSKFKIQNYNAKFKVLQSFIEETKKIARQEKCSFIRIAPIWERNEENLKLFRGLGFRKAPMHIHPELTWNLDLKPSEEELLRGMRKTTRYLIKQGQKNPDLRIIKSQDIKDIEIFNNLYKATVKKHHFRPFSLTYLQNEFLSFAKDDQAVIFLAKHNEEYLAAAIVIYWQGIGFYHQGASKESKIPAAYLLQWEAIREAKSRGCGVYNFWGIADVKTESKSKNHPWAGLSLFKKGFGGSQERFLKTQDFLISWKYWPSFFIEKLRKKRRGF